jgi:hypothetical protein
MIRILFKALLWSIIAVLTLEVCARVDDWVSYGASPFGLYDNSLLGAFDKMGQHGRPHGQYLKWKLNSLGFRGPELNEFCVWVPPRPLGSSKPKGMNGRASWNAI